MTSATGASSIAMTEIPVLREGRIYTRDPKEGRSVYGEEIISIDGNPHREWIPWRSKMAALLKLHPGSPIPFGRILYLGAAQGTTVSHLSDLNPDGVIFAVEFSRVPFVKLSNLARDRKNIVPILEDAFHPERYASMVGSVDFLYQDVSQKDQAGIFLKNADRVMSRSKLLELTKGYDHAPFDRSIDVCVGRLRKKIESDPSEPTYLRTIWGSGYLFFREG